jgi:hypothetical protein
MDLIRAARPVHIKLVGHRAPKLQLHYHYAEPVRLC